MSLLIATTGAPGAGKSTLARWLAPRIGALLVSTSEIKARLRPAFRAEDCLDERLRDEGYRLAFEACRSSLLAGQVAVLDAGFMRRRHREWLFDALGGVMRAVLWVECVCENEGELRRRIAARVAGRHGVDDQASSWEARCRLVATYERMESDEFGRDVPAGVLRVDSERSSCALVRDEADAVAWFRSVALLVERVL